MAEKKSPNRYDTFLGSIELNITGGTTDGQATEQDLIIETPKISEIRKVLGEQPCCSIGVAGPRGSGKTTLLKRLCYSYPLRESDKWRLAVMISAPVIYQPREFILHIFSSLCDEVLKINNEKPPGTSWADSVRDSQYSFLKPLAALSAFLGTSLIIVGWIIRSGGLGELASQEALILQWGTILATLGYGTILSIAFWKSLVRLMTIISRRMGRFNVKRKLIKEAKKHLTDIQFQQSYSTGWGGSLNMPVGLGTNVSRAITLAEKQRSLPKIVEEYKEFVKLASGIYQVVIGIDELDKIENDEEAQRFLNQIKGIFPSEAFYLLSVSEGAMSQFEKRGRPFRTAFDSSFRKIVYVDYLDFEQASDVLSERVRAGSLSIPFTVLCYCLSGGLARDLVRAFQDLYMFPGPADLMNLVTQSIRSDLDKKIRSMEFDAKKSLEVETAGESLVEKLRNLKTIDISVGPLLGAAKELYQDAAQLQQNMNKNKELNQDDALLQLYMSICLAYRELGVYLYFYATLLQTFGRKKSPRTWTKEGPEDIKVWASSLATARRSLSESSEVAKNLINRYREAGSMFRPKLLR